MSGAPRVAVVTTAHGRHDHLRRQRRSLAAGTRPPDLHVVVAMGDPDLAEVVAEEPLPTVVLPVATDACGLPLARARNLGMARAAAAGCDVLVGLDVDCLAGPHLLTGYADAVRSEPRTVWSGPVTYLAPGVLPRGGAAMAALDSPHRARPAPGRGERHGGGDPDLFWSLSYAVSTAAWRELGGYHEEYVGYGCEDTDLGRTAAARGIGLGWTGDARAYHQHHPVSDPPVEHLDALLRNARTFHRRWGEWPARGWFEAFESLGLVRRAGEGWEAATPGTGAVTGPPSGPAAVPGTEQDPVGHEPAGHATREDPTPWPTSSAR